MVQRITLIRLTTIFYCFLEDCIFKEKIIIKLWPNCNILLIQQCCILCLIKWSESNAIKASFFQEIQAMNTYHTIAKPSLPCGLVTFRKLSEKLWFMHRYCFTRISILIIYHLLLLLMLAKRWKTQCFRVHDRLNLVSEKLLGSS